MFKEVCRASCVVATILLVIPVPVLAGDFDDPSAPKQPLHQDPGGVVGGGGWYSPGSYHGCWSGCHSITIRDPNTGDFYSEYECVGATSAGVYEQICEVTQSACWLWGPTCVIREA